VAQEGITMSVDNVDTGDPIITPLGEELPGGFKSVEDMYAALEKTKAEAIENKTRKTNLTAAETELQKYKEAEAKRLDSERTELERFQAKIADLEKVIAEKDGAISKAQMNILFERELSTRLAGMDETSGKLMRMHYNAAVKDSDGFTDTETLKSILDPVDELLKGMGTKDGTKVVMNSTSLGTGESAKFSDNVKKLFGLNHGEILEMAKKGK